MSKSVLNDLSQFTENSNKLFLPHPIYNIFGDSVDKASARNNLQLNKEGKYLLFFGFIRRYKGLDLLLEAMAAKEVREIGVKLIVAGEYYGDEAYYEKIIKKLDIDNQLILNTNYISSDDVKHYFCAADMVVQPYRSATQSGITQIAYHFERPMLVTNTGGLPEIVTDGKVGYVVDVNSIDISNAIIDFYKNNKEDEFSQNTKHEKKRFQWSSFVDGLMKLVSSL
jgi:glycosyltransferase involved in cell wall biosynthesis